MIAAPALAIGLSDTSVLGVQRDRVLALAQSMDASRQEPAPPAQVRWEGLDIDGDGDADVVNPTGQAPRDLDAYGSGHFGASRDGGARTHQGVDYIAEAGQAVLAPISGFVTKIGLAYAGDQQLRFVEIDNPALKVTARVFYVEPNVAVGQPVRLGTPVGLAQTLQARYPGGITDHVHLEVADSRGRKLDAETLILARVGRTG